jgi:hypothetical protein
MICSGSGEVFGGGWDSFKVIKLAGTERIKGVV